MIFDRFNQKSSGSGGRGLESHLGRSVIQTHRDPACPEAARGCSGKAAKKPENGFPAHAIRIDLHYIFNRQSAPIFPL